MKPFKSSIVLMVLVPLLMGLHVLCSYRVQHIRTSVGFQNTIDAPLLPNYAMKLIAGEFKGLVADYLLLEISAFIDAGTEKTAAEWDRIAFHFSQAMALDPYFIQTYRMIQAFLPWKGKVKEANELLEVAKRHLTWDWYPGFYIGFNYFHELKDYANASKYLIEASKIEGAPALIATLGARLAQRSGQTVAALAFLKTMKRNPDYDPNAKKMIDLRIRVLEGALVLEQAVEVYDQRFGRPIDTFDDLVSTGILQKLPDHAEAGYYRYEDGRVKF